MLNKKKKVIKQSIINASIKYFLFGIVLTVFFLKQNKTK